MKLCEEIATIALTTKLRLNEQDSKMLPKNKSFSWVLSYFYLFTMLYIAGIFLLSSRFHPVYMFLSRLQSCSDYTIHCLIIGRKPVQWRKHGHIWRTLKPSLAWHIVDSRGRDLSKNISTLAQSSLLVSQDEFLVSELTRLLVDP